MTHKETRGRKIIYRFDDMNVGDTRTYFTYSANLIGCAKNFCKKNGLKWKFKSWSNSPGSVTVIRVR